MKKLVLVHYIWFYRSKAKGGRTLDVTKAEFATTASGVEKLLHDARQDHRGESWKILLVLDNGELLPP